MELTFDLECLPLLSMVMPFCIECESGTQRQSEIDAKLESRLDIFSCPQSDSVLRYGSCNYTTTTATQTDDILYYVLRTT